MAFVHIAGQSLCYLYHLNWWHAQDFATSFQRNNNILHSTIGVCFIPILLYSTFMKYIYTFSCRFLVENWTARLVLREILSSFFMKLRRTKCSLPAGVLCYSLRSIISVDNGSEGVASSLWLLINMELLFRYHWMNRHRGTLAMYFKEVKGISCCGGMIQFVVFTGLFYVLRSVCKAASIVYSFLPRGTVLFVNHFSFSKIHGLPLCRSVYWRGYTFAAPLRRQTEKNKLEKRTTTHMKKANLSNRCSVLTPLIQSSTFTLGSILDQVWIIDVTCSFLGKQLYFFFLT